MEGKIRNLYPGGNTPNGFYSYYNYILPQRKAEKIFCIKGGPGVGKSTLMKKIGQYFTAEGEDVDYMWCSSDPGSLDGILIKSRKSAIIDGTAPHIIDPQNPGAVDEIINLAQFLDEDSLRKNKSQIIRCSENTGRIFGYAYSYLRCAQQQYEFLSQILTELITPEEIREYKNQIQLKIDGISILRRAENKVKRDNVLGKNMYSGEIRKFFAGAITPEGIKNNIFSIINGIEKVIVLDVPVGFRSEQLLAPVSERLTNAGFDVEEYYCPMFPKDKLEHVVCVDANVAVICSNEYHTVDAENVDGKVVRVKVKESFDSDENGMLEAMFKDLRESSREVVLKAVKLLKEAKANHDILEDFYVSNMDFESMEFVKDDIIEKIKLIKVQ